MPVHADASASSPPAPVDELAAQFLRRGNTLRLRARGGSMLPFLRDGDVLEVRPATAGEITLGDVVCYEPPAGGDGGRAARPAVVPAYARGPLARSRHRLHGTRRGARLLPLARGVRRAARALRRRG